VPEAVPATWLAIVAAAPPGAAANRKPVSTKAMLGSSVTDSTRAPESTRLMLIVAADVWRRRTRTLVSPPGQM
jgi:hypothetical protein